MDRGYEKEIIEDDVTRVVRQAFGVNEDKLLRDFLLAQTEIKDDQIPPESEDGFERLLEKMKERNIKPSYLREHAASSRQSEITLDPIDGNFISYRPRRLKTMLKIAVVAAALMAMVLGMAITSRARRSYTYKVMERDVSGVDVVYNRATKSKQEDALEEAYKLIQEELGLNALKLSYIPEEMEFKKIDINRNRATLFFEYNNKIIYVVQQCGRDGSSYNFISDRKSYKTVYNGLLDTDILLQENNLDNGVKEFQTQIILQDDYYSIEGIMDCDEFEQIVKGLYISY